mgnify:CR=1 FL=1
MNMFQVLDTVSEISTSGPCNGLDWVVSLIKNGLFPILQWGIPIILIVLGTLDLGKAVIASDEKQVKEAQGKLVKRLIYAVLVFFVVFIVNFIFSMIGNIAGDQATDMNDWRNCWNSVMIYNGIR